MVAGHSVGGMLAIMVAALHAAALPAKSYPLSGLCTTGVADVWNPYLAAAGMPQLPLDKSGKFVVWPDAVKDAMMLMLPEGRADPQFLVTHANLNNPSPIDKVTEAMIMTPDVDWKVAAKDVEVPVLALVGEHDGMCDTSKAAIAKFSGLFQKTTVEQGVVANGPHSVELSHQGKAVFLKVLGHALQCAVGYGLEKEKET